MARINKQSIKVNFGSAVRSDPNVVEEPAQIAQRLQSIGPRSYENIFGELISTSDVPLVSEIHPLLVSQENRKNPFLYYLVDKISESVSKSIDDWQFATRIRGKVKVMGSSGAMYGDIIEEVSGLLFEETFPVVGLYPYLTEHDALVRSSLLDLSIPDSVPPLPTEIGIRLGMVGGVLSSSGMDVMNLNSSFGNSMLGQSPANSPLNNDDETGEEDSSTEGLA